MPDKKKFHKKPTKEELEANIKESQKKLDKLDDKTPSPSPSQVVPSPSPSPAIPSPSPSEPVPSPSPSEPIPSPSPPPGVDYKEKYIESSREAQILHARNKKVNEAIDAAMALDEPTEEELKREYPEWDEMTDLEKKLAKDTLRSKKQMKILSESSQEFKDIEAWNEKVDKYTADPQILIVHPELEGKIEEFKAFVTKPTRRGVGFEDLVPAFLYGLTKDMKPTKKGGMFPTGSGGPNKKPKTGSGKISIEEARRLRETDYKKFTELLKAGKIEEGAI